MYANVIKQFLAACQKLQGSDVIPSDAFISVKDASAQCYALNNALVPLKDASEDNVIIVDFNGNVVKGDQNGIDPYFAVHKSIYSKNPEIATVVNPRSRWNSIWASLGMSLTPNSFFYTKYFSGETLCTGSVMLEPGDHLYEAIGKAITTKLQHKGIHSRGAVIVRNDSALVWGKNPVATAERAIVLEEICFRALQTTSITQGGDSFVAWEVSEQLLIKED